MKKIVLLQLLLMSTIIFAQNELNNYKYIIVPVQFDAFKSPNQYKTSTIIKLLLTEKGLNVIYSDKLPPELVSNRCLALVANLKDDSNMFTTKTTLVFKDCNSTEIYTTKEGTSKMKEFNASYSEAITDALASLSGFNYVYKETSKQPLAVSSTNDKPKFLESHKEEPAFKKEIIEIQEPITNESATVKTTNTKFAEQDKDASLYAQHISNGYQLVDSTPKIVMKICRTSQPNIFIGENEQGVSGLVYSINGLWYFEFYDRGVLKSQALNIKF